MRWYAMSTRFLTDPKIEQLGEKHGPVGPLLIVSLLAHAGVQEAGGEVERTFRATAHEVFSNAEKVGEVLDDAIESGLCHAMSRDVTGFRVRFPTWKRYQANFRKAKSRSLAEAAEGDEKPHEQADVTAGHEESRDVTAGHTLSPTRQDKTRQNKTEQDKTEQQQKQQQRARAPVVADRDDAVVSPSNAFSAWLQHYHAVTGKTTVRGSDPARRAFAARLKEGRTLEDLKLATAGCHSDEYCRDHGYNVPETILRAEKVERYIQLGREPSRPRSKGSSPASRVDADVARFTAIAAKLKQEGR